MSYVEVIFIAGNAAQFSGAFQSAANFWNDMITSGAAPLVFGAPFNVQGLCGVNFQFLPGDVITGVTIFASVISIDGPGSVLGRAGPCGFVGNFAKLGIMEFDSSDINTLAGAGSFEAVILHEMAHVLGIGTLWSSFGLIANPCPSFGVCTTDPRYLGSQGNTGFAQLGGSGLIPIANTGGAGTANGHWRESTFDNELMTGFLDSGFNPVSIMTVRAFRDLGFGTDLSSAQSYSIPREGEESQDPKFELVGDVIEIQLMEDADLEAAILKAEQQQQQSFERNVFIAIALSALVAVAAIVAAIARNRRRNNKTGELPTTQ